MAIKLPEGKLEAVRVNPKMFLMYALPKVGKTKLLSELESNLILDFEGGAEMYSCARVPITRCEDIDETCNAILTKGAELGGKFPYKYISIDTVDILEDFVETRATALYNKSPEGKKNPVETVADLPYGAGYGMIRKGVVQYMEKLASMCQYLIIVAHVKEKLLNKNGMDITSRDISLSGKLAGIVCSKVDAIGYLSRTPEVNNGNIMVSFQTFDNSVMGARCEHLAGKQFPFEWSKIYLEGKK